MKIQIRKTALIRLVLANTFDRFKRESNVITSIQLYSRMVRLECIAIEDYHTSKR